MKPIALTNNGESRFYEYKRNFTVEKCNAVLKITADYKYAAYINGIFVCNTQASDTLDRKSVCSVDISDKVKQGENELFVIAMHMDAEFSVARNMPAFLAFEIISEGKIIVSSDCNTLARCSLKYNIGDVTTPQLGYGIDYDFTVEDSDFMPCKELDLKVNFVPRAIKNLKIGEPLDVSVVAQGDFKYSGGKNTAEKMQFSYMNFSRFEECTGLNRLKYADLHEPLTFKTENADADGVYIIVDLSRECAGHLMLSVNLDKACKGGLCWGEHLADLRVRSAMGGRNFAYRLTFKKGKNTLDERILRLGCRYLCLFVECDRVTVNRFTLVESLYPFNKPEKNFNDRLLNRIYETGRRTLELCAHEHYEDCPWREQALYGMDSANQMLFGYGAFNEYEFPRESIRLMAETRKPNGLIELCAPSHLSFTIPSFSAYMVMAICENAEVDYNKKFVSEMLPHAKDVMRVFENHSDNSGVSLFHEVGFWNFHEWSEGLEGGVFGRDYEEKPAKDGILTAVVCITAKKFAKLLKTAGDIESAKKMSEYANMLENSLENFYDKASGLYCSYIDADGKRGYHGYMQAAAAMAVENMPKDRLKTISEVLKNPCGKVVEPTFAVFRLKYEAIIKADEKNIGWVIDDICNTFGKMLFSGATSYWETAFGEADFGDAGSLCHGWSAVPCYIFDKYLK